MSEKTEKIAPENEKALRPRFKKTKKKICQYCFEKSKEIDYKDVAKLRKCITEKGKILPRRQTGLCARHQREVTVAIKRARVMALLPFKAD